MAFINVVRDTAISLRTAATDGYDFTFSPVCIFTQSTVFANPYILLLLKRVNYFEM